MRRLVVCFLLLFLSACNRPGSATATAPAAPPTPTAEPTAAPTVTPAFPYVPGPLPNYVRRVSPGSDEVMSLRRFNAVTNPHPNDASLEVFFNAFPAPNEGYNRTVCAVINVARPLI